MISMEIKSLLRRFLGIDDLENKVRILENEKAELENKAIEAEKSKELIRQSAQERDLSLSSIDAFRELGVYVTKQNELSAKAGIKAADAVVRYGFERYVPAVGRTYPKAVISIDELRSHPEEYMHKLSKGMLSFPINFNLKKIDEFLYDNYGNISVSSNVSTSGNPGFSFAPGTFMRVPDSSDFKQVMIKTTELANLQRIGNDTWVYMDVPDFLHNFDGLVKMIKESPTEIERKIKCVEALYMSRAAYMTALEILGTARIKDASELLGCRGYDKRYVPPDDISGVRKLKEDIRSLLVSDMPGTTKYDVAKYMPVRSVTNFRELCSKRTLEIMAMDSERGGLTSEIGKDINDYSIGESVVLACYFARSVIEKGSTLEDTIKEIFFGESDSKISGKCTDYTGLALQYLNEYLIPLNPEKFAGWTFGVESTHIESYNHAFIKILHENENGHFDIYFVDPTRLASKGIKELKTPKDVLNYTSANKNPVEIIREAEDFLVDPINREAK